jgi:hypothetical protein
MRALPIDPALPHLAHALDPQAMALTFAGLLGGLKVRTCEVDRVKYRPGRNCSVSYKLQLHDPRDGRAFEQRVAARFCSGDDAQRRHHHAMLRPSVASAAGPALSHSAALDMLAHWLPNDHKLAALALLCNDAELRKGAGGCSITTQRWCKSCPSCVSARGSSCACSRRPVRPRACTPSS